MLGAVKYARVISLLLVMVDHFDTGNALISRTQKSASVLYESVKGLAELFIPAARKVAEQDIFEV